MVSEPRFAAWVDPIALRLRDSRDQIVHIATMVAEERWQDPSPVEGWSFKDLLAHLAEGDVFCQTAIELVLSGGSFDMRDFSRDRDTRNARIIEEGRGMRVTELIDGVRDEGEETQRLLARLTAIDERCRLIVSNSTPEPVSLGSFLRSFSHDDEHRTHLTAALGSTVDQAC